VVKRCRDAALVAAAQETQILTQMTWAPHHRLETVLRPDGAVTRYVLDGYGYLYKAFVDDVNGGLQVEPLRYIYDVDGYLVYPRDDLGHELKLERYDPTGPTVSPRSGSSEDHGARQSQRRYLQLRRQPPPDGSDRDPPSTGAEARRTELCYDALCSLDRISVRPRVRRRRPSHRVGPAEGLVGHRPSERLPARWST
jgi:hypothetical protein